MLSLSASATMFAAAMSDGCVVNARLDMLAALDSAPTATPEAELGRLDFCRLKDVLLLLLSDSMDTLAGLLLTATGSSCLDDTHPMTRGAMARPVRGVRLSTTRRETAVTHLHGFMGVAVASLLTGALLRSAAGLHVPGSVRPAVGQLVSWWGESPISCRVVVLVPRASHAVCQSPETWPPNHEPSHCRGAREP